MNVSNNIRFQTTEEKIENALIRLLKKKKYDSIFVKDICLEAAINRSSFYSHYYDINDLMMKFEKKISQEIVGIFKNTEFDNGVFVKFFNFIKENAVFYKAFLKSNHVFSFLEKDMVVSLEKTLLKVGNLHNVKYDLTQFSYHLCFFGNGLKGICQRWLENGCVESPQYMANILIDEYFYNKK